jgi:hypothetical protein
MDFLEKNLEDIIFETDNELLEERGLYLFGKKRRQVNLGNYGIADIVIFDKNSDHVNNNIGFYPIISFTVLELKQDKIDAQVFFQALRYCKGIQEYIKKRGLFNNAQILFEIVLIGKQIDTNSSFIFLTDFIGAGSNMFSTHDYFSLDVYTYSYQFDGIKFKRIQDYSLTNSGFNFNNCKSYQRKNSF